MNQGPNPYPPPAPYQASPYGVPVANRTPFVLAAAGAWLASAYWAVMTGLLGLGAMLGSGSVAQIILPVVLIGLYAMRGFQIFKGDPNAARRILWLHGIGAVAALIQALGSFATGSALVAGLQGMKVVINVFGGITAYYAYRSYVEAMRQPAVAPYGTP
ncbi:MAG: hypothetical protein ABSE49_21375 [Polyangiaceae bacterium]